MRVLLIIAIAIMGYFTACIRTSGNMPDKSKAQSTPHFVVALFDTGSNGKPGLRLDFAYRIIRDTVKFISINESTQKKLLTKDTTYYILWPIPAKDSTGKQLHKPNGSDSLKSDWMNIDKRRILIDGGRVDTAVVKYKQPK